MESAKFGIGSFIDFALLSINKGGIWNIRIPTKSSNGIYHVSNSKVIQQPSENQNVFHASCFIFLSISFDTQ